MKIIGELIFKPSSMFDTVYDVVDRIFTFLEFCKIHNFSIEFLKIFGIFNNRKFEAKINDKKEDILERYFRIK